MTVRTIDEIWRDYNTNGVPASGAHKPIKADIRDTLNAKFDEISDIAVGGIKWKDPVRVATTASGTWASAFDNGSTIDGVVIATGNRILIKNQTAGEENGIYVVQASGAPLRATDADTSDEILRAGVYVEEGTTNGGTQYVTMTSPITLNTTPIVFTKVDDNGDTASEINTARFGLPSLNYSIDMARNTAFTEVGDNIFDPLTPVFMSGKYNTEASFGDNAIGRAQPFDWDGARFDYVKVWVRPVAGDAVLRVAVWSADRATLYASGYVNSFRTINDTPNFVWVKLNRPITTTVVAAGVLYLSVDGISSDTALNGRIATFEVDERDTPDLATYPLYLETYTPTPSTSLSAWDVVADTLRNGIVFEIYNSRSTVKRSMTKSNPRPEQIVMTPRLFGIVNTQMNVYSASLVAGRKQKSFYFTGIAQGRQLSERWTALPTVPASGTLRMRVMDPDNQSDLDVQDVPVSIVAENAAAGATRVICAMGDSTTAGGQWTQRVLDKAAANANGVQPTFQGTKGTGVNKFEAVGGRRLIHFYQPTTVGLAADNPFVTGVNQYFDAEYYMTSNPTFSVPDIVIWHLGLNESIAQLTTSETVMMAVARTYCQQLGEMIGVYASANPVVPWSDVDANIKHIVALPIATGTQDGFGVPLYAGLNYHEGLIHRYLHILRNRIVEVFGGAEGDGIFLMPWHVANDPVNGFEFANETWNVNTARTIDRAQDGIHPIAAALGGYQQMGDSAWATLNGGVALGLF